MRIGQTSFVSFLSQLISSVAGLAATLYITQTLGGSVFGQYALVVAVGIWLQVVGLFGVETAITQRMAATEDGDEYLTAGAAMVLGAFAVIALVLFVLSDRVTAYLGADVLLLLLAIVFGGLCFSFVAAALSGEHRVHLANLLQPLNVTFRSGVQILAVATSVGLGGLLVGHAGGSLVGALIGAVLLRTRFSVPERHRFRDVLGFARYSWLGKLSSRSFSAMDTIVLGLFVAPNFIGYYEAAWNLASILAVFGSAIAQSVFPKIGNAAAQENAEFIRGALSDATAFTGLLLFPGIAGAIVIGPRVMAIYGEGFARAGMVLVVLCSARLAYAFGEQFISALNAIDRPDLAYRINGVFLLANIGLNLLLVYAVGWLGAAVATAISAALVLVIAYRFVNKELTVSIPYWELLRQSVAAATMAVLLSVILPWTAPTIGWTLVLVALSAAVYFAILFMLSSRFRGVVRRNLPVS